MSTARDVYAGDNDMGGGFGLSQRSDYHFEVVADGDPDTLVRIASQFLLSNKLPSIFDMRVNDGRAMAVAELRDITSATAESIRRKLAQLTCMDSVCVRQTPRSFAG